MTDLNNVYFYIIPKTSTSLLEDAVSDSGDNYCNLRSLLSPTFNTTLAEIHHNHDLQAKHYPALPQVRHRFTQPAVYQMFLMHCGNHSLSFNLAMKRFNVNNNDHATHLELGYTHTPLVYQVFGFYIWPVVVTLWGINYFYYRKQGVQALYLFLGTVNLSVLLWCSFNVIYYNVLGQQGVIPSIVLALRCIISFISRAAICVTLLLITKGWDITRTYLTLAEWRAVVGVSAFIALADTFYMITGTVALFNVLVLRSTEFLYLYGNYTHVAAVLTLYMERLASQLSEPRLPRCLQPARLSSGISMVDSRVTSRSNSQAPISTRANSMDARMSITHNTTSIVSTLAYPTGENLLRCYSAKLTLLSKGAQFILLTFGGEHRSPSIGTYDLFMSPHLHCKSPFRLKLYNAS
ncbi:hypothetical protein IWQ61_005454 [Dispira simplex]|nr:hypothetical protein IWQ61_005454 [Dispira simplex]